MKMIFQFINHETGYRSDAFEGDYEILTTVIEARDADDPEVRNEDYILLVAITEGDSTTIPKAPLITVGSFMSLPNPPRDMEGYENQIDLEQEIQEKVQNG